MALPTAATPGYGVYPTLGPAPDVACNCLREWLPVFKRMLRFKGLGEIDVWQCTGDASASGGTHSLGGAFDFGGIRNDRAMVAREMGAPATWPRNWSGNQHTHGVLDGCPHNDPAHYQITAMRVFRRNGLGWNGLLGPDPLPPPSRYRTWREGIEWAEAQMSPKEDDVNLSDRVPLTDGDRAAMGTNLDDISVAALLKYGAHAKFAAERAQARLDRLEQVVANLAAVVASQVHDKSVQSGLEQLPLGLAVGQARATANRIETLLKEKL